MFSRGGTRGRCSGGRAIEALGDHRVEGIARQAREAGWASGEESTDESGADQRPARNPRRPARRSPILGVWLVLEDVAEPAGSSGGQFIDNLSHGNSGRRSATIGLLVESLARDAEGPAARPPGR